VLSVENLSVIEAEGARILELGRRNPDLSVPQYPEWTVRDLISHTASIHGRTTLVCQTLPLKRISAPRLPEGADELDWYEETLAGMLASLRAADPTSEVWAFDSVGTIAFWERRMVVETGVHRWDAEQAFGEPDPLLDEVSRAGLDEFPVMWLQHLGELPPLQLRATDLDETWVYGTDHPEQIVEGTASEIYLRLMARQGVELPESWAKAIDRMAPPPKR